MDFGGGLNFGLIYAEIRYHYIWGPTVAPRDRYSRCPASAPSGKPTVSSWRPRLASASRAPQFTAADLPRGGDAPPVRASLGTHPSTPDGRRYTSADAVFGRCRGQS